jgi:hypothetical protein
MSLVRELRSVAAMTLVALMGTALVLVPGTVAGGAPTHHQLASARAPMQPTPPGGAPVWSPANTVSAINWSGYAATGAIFSDVSASWVVPAVTCTSGAQYSSAWVGLDGFNSRTVEQTGTDSDCHGATPRYYSWYEMYPAASVNIAEPVSAGDQMNASVTAATTSSFVLVIADATKGWTKTFTKTLARAKRTSAEVIEEAPCCTAAQGILPLADFGKINFTNAHVDGGAIGNLSPKRINMAAGGVLKDTTSALTNGANFSVTWDHR